MTAHCRACGTPLVASLVDLGSTPLANSYLPDAGAIAREKSFPLHVKVCTTCFLAQVDEAVPPEEIFDHGYAYLSSYATSWVEHARRYAEAMIARFSLGQGARVIEIASNDGYLLKHFLPHGIKVLGIEPAGHAAELARAVGVESEVRFFNEQTGKDLAARGITADLMAANNVLAHVPDMPGFLAGFQHVLTPQGVLTFEFPHLLNLMSKVQFDTIYHEHYSYLSLLAVEYWLERVGLRAFDVEELSTHGGSLRVFVCRKDSDHQPQPGLEKVRADEAEANLGRLEGYMGFAPRVEAVKAGFLAFLEKARAEGKTVAGYGAAAKGNTFLNVCGVGAGDMTFVADRNPEKQNKLLPGSHIPVKAPEAILAEKPDYVVILPWNLAGEIKDSLAGIRAWGGRFVTAVPAIEID